MAKNLGITAIALICFTISSMADPVPSTSLASANANQGVWLVTFKSTTKEGNSKCAGGAAGESASVETVDPTSGCMARHGASSDRLYYKLTLNSAGTAIESVAYDCTNSNCTDCYFKDVKFNECASYTDESGTVQSVSFRNGPNFLPNDSSNAPKNGITVATYNQCAHADELLLYNSVGPLTNVSGVCKSMGGGLYQSLYLDIDNKINGGFLCPDESCSSSDCDIEMKKTSLGQSVVNSEGCFSTYDSVRFNIDLGNQPPCRCNIDHVYVNIFTSDNEDDQTCGLGKPFETAIITRVKQGYSKLNHVPSGFNEVIRYLELEWDSATSSVDVNSYGFGCVQSNHSCQQLLKKPDWSTCYKTTGAQGSTSIFKPESICYGSLNLHETSGVAVYGFYGSSTCPTDLDADESAVLQIRGYGPSAGTCTWDGLAGSSRGRYNLTETSTDGVTYYSGGFGCNENCSTCSVSFDKWQQGMCYTTSYGSIQIWPTDKLERCADAPAPPPPMAPTPSPSDDPNSFVENSPIIVIGACVGAAVFAAAIGGFVVYMRRKSASNYESLVGRGSRSRSRARQSPRKGRNKRRGQQQAAIYRDATFYDGI